MPERGEILGELGRRGLVVDEHTRACVRLISPHRFKHDAGPVWALTLPAPREPVWQRVDAGETCLVPFTECDGPLDGCCALVQRVRVLGAQSFESVLRSYYTEALRHYDKNVRAPLTSAQAAP